MLHLQGGQGGSPEADGNDDRSHERRQEAAGLGASSEEVGGCGGCRLHVGGVYCMQGTIEAGGITAVVSSWL